MNIIKEVTSETIIVKRSKFISIVKPVLNYDEVLSFFLTIKKNNYRAKHNVTAYILGEKGEVFKCNDDNEPVQTAGKPALLSLQKYKLTNVAVVVSRYFGGILLGKAGLIKAYSSVVDEAIKKAVLYKVIKAVKLKITCDYLYVNNIINTLKQYDLIKINYLDKVYFEYLIPNDILEKIIFLLKSKTNNNILIDINYNDKFIYKSINEK